ncbi:MAG: oxygen-independent coproporphyrinogen III oxidase [Alphaproteobacteria bacterium]
MSPTSAHMSRAGSGSNRQPAPSDIALAEQSVPRYTSYPTAPHFSQAVSAGTYRSWLKSQSPCATLSLYIHVPFCQAMCAYCGCNTKVVRREEPLEAYRDRLMREIDMVAASTMARRVTHIHWGGGTPSMLGLTRIIEVVERIAQRFDLSGLIEHAVELDPRQVTDQLATGLKAIGVTRASLGVQDLNEHVQKAIGRVQPLETVAAATQALRDAGIEAINIDLMYGLPTQTEADISRTIGLAESLAPDRIALFGYAHVPWFKSHQKLIREEDLPSATERMTQAQVARDAFLALGYEPIGLDHFARAHDPMAIAARAGELRRNFQGYTVDNADTLLGLGASAIGSLPQGYVQNAPDFGAFNRAIDANEFATVRGYALNADDRLRALVIEKLMCGLEVDLDGIADRFGAPSSEFHSSLERIEPLESAGLVHVSGHRLQVTERGRPFVRLVAAAFDAHLSSAARHSAAI